MTGYPKIDITAAKPTPFFNVLMFSTFWALQIFTAKLGFNAGAEVISFQVLSMAAVLSTFALLLLPRVGEAMRRLYKHQQGLFWGLFFANGLQAGLGTFLSLVGIAMTEAINAGFLVKMATVTTILFAWLILKERLSLLKVITVFVMLGGAYLLTTKGQALLPRTGDLFILGACICWSLGNVLVRKYLVSQPLQPDVVTLLKPLAGFPVLLTLIGISVYFPGEMGEFNRVLSCCAFSWQYLPYALVSGICLAMAWIYLYRTLKVATSSYMTLMSMLTPVIVSLLAMVFLGETLLWMQLLGAGMIFLGGVIIYSSDIVYA